MEISKAKISRYALLRHKKYREKEGLFLVQGSKAVADTRPWFECVDIIESAEAIKKISTLENLPDVVAVYKIPEREATLTPLPKDRFYLVLDGVQDPGNLGTIIRTAHWFGVNRIFCSRNTVDVYNPKVVMSTMGSIAKVDVTYCDLKELFEINGDLPVYGLLLEGENLFEVQCPAPGIIVMGSEGHGPSDETRLHITKAFTIPPAHTDDHPDSLNVAIATAVTLSQLIR